MHQCPLCVFTSITAEAGTSWCCVVDVLGDFQLWSRPWGPLLTEGLLGDAWQCVIRMSGITLLTKKTAQEIFSKNRGLSCSDCALFLLCSAFISYKINALAMVS